MMEIRWRALFEAIGLMAVVASLIFVGIQLRQDQAFARSELGSGSFSQMAILNQTMTTPEFAETYAKMLDRPEDLSVNEMLQINGLLHLVIEHFQRECYMVSTTVFVECDVAILEFVPMYFGNRYAKSWWAASKKRWKGQYADYRGWVNRVDVQINKLDLDSNRRNLGEIIAGL